MKAVSVVSLAAFVALFAALGAQLGCTKSALPQACQPLRDTRSQLDWMAGRVCPLLPQLELSAFDRLELERVCAYTKAREPRAILNTLCPHPQANNAQ